MLFPYYAGLQVGHSLVSGKLLCLVPHRPRLRTSGVQIREANASSPFFPIRTRLQRHVKPSYIISVFEELTPCYVGSHGDTATYLCLSVFTMYVQGSPSEGGWLELQGVSQVGEEGKFL